MPEGMSSLDVARAELREAQAKLSDYKTALENAQAAVQRPDYDLLGPLERAEFERDIWRGIELTRAQTARVKELLEVRIPEAAAEQPEYPEWHNCWSNYAQVLTAHLDLVPPVKDPPDVDLSPEQEAEISNALGFPYLLEVGAWAKTFQYPQLFELDLWPHELPTPPSEPPNVWEKLESYLDDEDASTRSFVHSALSAMANARAVTDYKAWWSTERRSGLS